MKELELLIDKCLHDEASEDEKQQLKKMIDESDEAFEFYLKSLEQHSDLKEWAESQEKQESQVIPFPFMRWMLALTAILVLGFVIFVGGAQQPNLFLDIHSVSSNYKVIRGGEMVKGVNRIEMGDQILVGEGGQVRLDVQGQESHIFLMSNSSVNFMNRDCNRINLQQGEIRAKLQKQSTPFVIKTNEGEAEIIGTEFSLSDKGETQLWVTSGEVRLNRGEKDSILVGAGQRIDTESFRVEAKAGDQLIPDLYQGVEFFYYRNKRETLTLDNDMALIDHGVRRDFNYITGAYDGYVRAAPTHRSLVSTDPFLIVLKSHYDSSEEGSRTLQVNSLRQASLRINEKLYHLDEQGKVEVPFNKGFNLIELRTIGGQERNTGDVLLELKELKSDGSLRSLQKDLLYYSTTEEVPDISHEEMNQALTCDLPLREDFADRANGVEAIAVGEPVFVEDPEMGRVLELDGMGSYLEHLNADELGLNGSYTVSCKIYFDELMQNKRPDDGIFSTAFKRPVDGNSTLVLLIRRGHPYQAHFANDTVSSQVLEDKRWYALSFRFENGVQSIFVDGELVTSSQGHSNLYSKEKLQIGTWSGNHMKGRICDVKIFNRALSINNIASLND